MNNYVRDLVSHMSDFVTENRLAAFETVLSNRTRYVTIVLEDIFQAQNASAVVRSCDCFGIQDLHIIENSNDFKVDMEVSLGSDKWLDIYTHNKESSNTQSTIKMLREKGYRIIATSPHRKQVAPGELDLEAGPCAILFGTELTGLSEQAMEQADEYLSIPMYGFAESFNISVSVALILYELRKRLNRSEINWELPENEYLELKLKWLRSTIKMAGQIEKNFKINYPH